MGGCCFSENSAQGWAEFPQVRAFLCLGSWVEGGAYTLGPGPAPPWSLLAASASCPLTGIDHRWLGSQPAPKSLHSWCFSTPPVLVTCCRRPRLQQTRWLKTIAFLTLQSRKAHVGASPGQSQCQPCFPEAAREHRALL